MIIMFFKCCLIGLQMFDVCVSVSVWEYKRFGFCGHLCCCLLFLYYGASVGKLID